jgi:hypothetical protein
MEGFMQRTYYGLPAAASVEQSIVAAQRLILRDIERVRRPRPARVEPGTFPAISAFHGR